MRDLSTHWVLCVPAATHTLVFKPEAVKQAFYTQRKTKSYGPEMEGFRFLGAGGNWSCVMSCNESQKHLYQVTEPHHPPPSGKSGPQLL